MPRLLPLSLIEIKYLSNKSKTGRPALRYFEKALTIDNLNEELYCQAMHAYAALGDRTSKDTKGTKVLNGSPSCSLVTFVVESFLALVCPG